MSAAGLRTALRVIAVLIAVAAALDPAFSRVIASSRPIVIVRAATVPIDMAEQALRAELRDRTVTTRAATHGRVPCANDEDCVLIADGSIDVEWGSRFRPIALLQVALAGAPNVQLRSATVSRGHRAAAGTARVRLEARGAAGKRTEVRVLDGQAVLGTVTYEWSQAADAVVDVPWWPIDDGARALRIEAVPIDGELTTADNHIDIGVSIGASRIPILVFDARPSWHSTFIRRALEDDTRFAVGYRSRLAPAVSAGTPNSRLDAATLDRVPLVIIGAPDALTASDVSLLESYVRRRGGTLVLLPERRPSGDAARLFAGNWSERLIATPEAIGPLRASELLHVANLSPAATVIAASGATPVVVATPSGAGRIIVAGAMDAWRYRDADAGGFDRFWRSLAAEGAAAGEGLTLTFGTTLLEYGARVAVTVRDRRMDAVTTSEASVVQRCLGMPAQPVRVWPSGSIGEFVGEISAVSNGTCTIDARVGDREVSTSLAVVDHASRAVDDTLAKLERRVRASGGVVAEAGDEVAIARALGDATEESSQIVSVYPMRAPWWILPFAGCLSLEWFLRRRSGLR